MEGKSLSCGKKIPQLWKENPLVVEGKSAYVLVVEEKSTYISVVERKSTYISVVERKSTYISVVERKSTYISVVERKSTYISVVERKSTYATKERKMDNKSKELIPNNNNDVSIISEYDNIIEKSNPLAFLSFEGWTLLEVNIFEFYLSKINPRDTGSSDVIIRKKDIEKITQVKRIRNEVFAKACDNLKKREVKIYYHKYQNLEISLFDAKAIKKDEKGNLIACFSCSEKAKKYLFDITGLGYIKYKLKEAILLPTISSKIFYFVFLTKQYSKDWRVSVEELREILGYTNIYDNRDLVSKIIKPSLDYINNYTELEIAFSKEVGARNKTLFFVFSISSKVNYKRIIKVNEKQCIESGIIKENTINLIIETLRVSRESAKTIILKAEEKNVNTDELRKLIKYINNKIEKGEKISNKTSYILSLLDNEANVDFYDKKNKQYSLNDFPQTNTDDDLDYLERNNWGIGR